MSQQIREGSGSVGRITALVLANNKQLRDHIRLCTRSGVVSLVDLRLMRKLAEEALRLAEIADSQIAIVKHFTGAISYGQNTVEHMANVGLHVVKGPLPSNVIPFRGRASIDTEIA